MMAWRAQTFEEFNDIHGAPMDTVDTCSCPQQLSEQSIFNLSCNLHT